MRKVILCDDFNPDKLVVSTTYSYYPAMLYDNDIVYFQTPIINCIFINSIFHPEEQILFFIHRFYNKGMGKFLCSFDNKCYTEVKNKYNNNLISDPILTHDYSIKLSTIDQYVCECVLFQSPIKNNTKVIIDNHLWKESYYLYCKYDLVQFVTRCRSFNNLKYRLTFSVKSSVDYSNKKFKNKLYISKFEIFRSPTKEEALVVLKQFLHHTLSLPPIKNDKYDFSGGIFYKRTKKEFESKNYN
jgi:hypothetical protein